MKVLWKIALLLLVLLAVFYFMESRIQENAPLESPVKHGTAIPDSDKQIVEMAAGPKRPETGISTLVGKSFR